MTTAGAVPSGTLTAQAGLSCLPRGMTAPPAGEESSTTLLRRDVEARSRALVFGQISPSQRTHASGPVTPERQKTAAILKEPAGRRQRQPPAMVTPAVNRRACAPPRRPAGHGRGIASDRILLGRRIGAFRRSAQPGRGTRPEARFERATDPPTRRSKRPERGKGRSLCAPDDPGKNTNQNGPVERSG